MRDTRGAAWYDRLIFGAARLYLEQNRQQEAALVEAGNEARADAAAKKSNSRMQGNRRYPPKRYGYGRGGDDVVIVVSNEQVTA